MKTLIMFIIFHNNEETDECDKYLLMFTTFVGYHNVPSLVIFDAVLGHGLLIRSFKEG